MKPWPPTLGELKADAQIPGTGDDVVLQYVLDAAASVVERVRADLFRVDSPPAEVPADILLGTIRLAAREFARRRSPEALIDMGEMGSARIPSFDPDIERLLGIGRFRGPVFA